jgi:ATP adenylyltransferase
MADNLYSPWRFDYIDAKKQDGCIFCIKGEDDEKRLVLHRTEYSFVIMNPYPYNNGHLMVVPKRHLSNLNDLSSDEMIDLFDTVRNCEAILKERYHPDGLNIGLNLGKAAGAGVADHLHVHLVPRWSGDSNFMSTIAEIRVIPEDFNQAYKTLKQLFEVHYRKYG